MLDLDQSWILLILMAIGLGMRHGLDLDHIATIDAITRTAHKNHLVSRLTGFLFSLGHGIPVILLSLLVGSGLVQSRFPHWLDSFGKWISVFFLFVFGTLNLISLFRNPSQSALPSGLKLFIFKKIAQKKMNPLLIMGIGALFALSFDTFSQVALFSLSASLLAGWFFSGILGIFFTLGMMFTDGLNGMFVATIIQRADRKSLILSKTLGWIISIFSFLIGFIGLLSFF